MNRLVLIGNGFDLAHGLKTSYSDFIKYYLSKIINMIMSEGISKYDDELITISFHSRDYYQKQEISIRMEEEDFFDFFEILKRNEILSIGYKSDFFDSCCHKIQTLRWVDIENEYFNALSICKKKDGSFDFDKVKTLNEQLEYLREELHKYLTEISNEWQYNKEIHCDFLKQLSMPMAPRMITKNGLRQADTSTMTVLLLSFNYTKLTSEYLNQLEEKAKNGKDSLERSVYYRSINIHGNLSEADSMIFGFGDEFDKKFLEFEDQNNNALFKHIKSFGYVKSDQYQTLLKFINGSDFEVHVMGHSCGLSDRTLLREIFDRENCINVQLFYHEKSDGTSDLDEKRFDLYRHFSNKARYRKIVSHQAYKIAQVPTAETANESKNRFRYSRSLI